MESNTTYLQKAQERILTSINWNYVGVVSGVLSVAVAAYNILEYTKKIRAGKSKNVRV